MSATQLNIDGYEKVVHFVDEASGLNALISVHDTTLGPALGGCRMYPYGTFEEALEDVLRLSKGMTYKNALAGIDHGGGKAVIIGDPKTDKSADLFRAFGRAIDGLGGLYYTAEDVGITVKDIECVGEVTPFVSGTNSEGGGAGNPSPFTAYGVFVGIQEAVAARLERVDLKGVRVIVNGLGHVGMALCRLLDEAGAKLIVSDIDTAKLYHAVQSFGATPAHYDEAFGKEADIYAPCALGGAINSASVKMLQVSIVAGAANNQLATPDMGAALHERGILYAPDYVINCGGVICVAGEVAGGWPEEDVMKRIRAMAPTLRDIFALSLQENRPTHEIADQMAEARLSRASEGQRTVA